jgi:hypothetical protein
MTNLIKEHKEKTMKMLLKAIKVGLNKWKDIHFLGRGKRP